MSVCVIVRSLSSFLLSSIVSLSLHIKTLTTLNNFIIHTLTYTHPRKVSVMFGIEGGEKAK